MSSTAKICLALAAFGLTFVTAIEGSCRGPQLRVEPSNAALVGTSICIMGRKGPGKIVSVPARTAVSSSRHIKKAICENLKIKRSNTPSEQLQRDFEKKTFICTLSLREGKVSEVAVTKSTGISEIDAAAVHLVKTARPEECLDGQFEVELPSLHVAAIKVEPNVHPLWRVK